ncbi:MAG: hypothetical protein ACTHOB_01100 [Ginsengibacter sp.]
MKCKRGKLLFIFLALFSLHGFSQTPEKSNHPLLDKYYPRPQVDTPQTVIIQRPAPETPVPQKIVPQKSIAPPPPVKPSVAEKIVPESKPVAVATDSSVITKPVEPVVSAPTTPAVSAPVAPVASAQVQPVVATPKPAASKPSTPYNRERLGSSSPLYNTWEKNNNGAGSVTTGSK